jgi:hypothetical protein
MTHVAGITHVAGMAGQTDGQIDRHLLAAMIRV